MTEKEKKEIIELVHKTLRGFFGPFPEGELGARPLTQTEKTLLEVNKVLCEKIQEMPTVERPHGEWDKEDVRLINYLTRKCLECGKNSAVGNFCMWCGADMRKEENAK